MKKCDLVMKGGITSGIVYPGAVLELSREYEFANIGGTSAGAIAAALTAAAEYRRKSGGGEAGFARLAELPAWMAEHVDGRSRLLSLFAPARETAGLFAVLLAFLETDGTTGEKVMAMLGAMVRRSWFALVAAIVGIALIALAAVSADHIAILVVIAALVAVTVGAAVLAAVVETAMSAAKTLPKQGFGISTGSALAEWLSAEIDGVAGVDHPLTFADLRAHELNLEMMTTNLTHGRPYRLPMETHHFFFDESEMRVLFPAHIVDWMIAHAEPRQALHALPSEQLPVVVAARMSLSFPLLLSAVPLWSIDRGRAAEEQTPERCWFSDGGITSNFPVHFFDAALPRWPTFAINLAPRMARYHRRGERVYMPRNNRGGILEWWSPFDDLLGFLGAIAGTMQNWRDNMLLHLPGQRDRIAHVLLAEDEGGLNLTMEKPVIDDLARRGAEAGRMLREQFSWTNHKWVRFLSFMSAFEPALEEWARGFGEVRPLLEGAEPLPSYKVSATERAAMRDASLAFLRHVQEDFAPSPFRRIRKRPRPEPELRVMPKE
ncbi:MAG TPA: patatin-like phospholipase family protein [Thermoanaerobaculia bacterium]|nr:patatin-like phospholipase family protein [Thermoanaerobaculia bacterium]